MRVLPERIWGNTKRSRSGEPLIFKLLESINLGETSVALHSLNLVGNRKQKSFELDFLVVTTNFILGLEVKAGKVESKDGVWIVYEHDRPWVESYRKKVSPFVQALNALDKFRTEWIPETFAGDQRRLFGSQIFVPVAILCENSQPDRGFENPSEMPPSSVLWKEDLFDPDKFKMRLNEAVNFYRQQVYKSHAIQKLSADSVNILTSTIRPDLDLSYPSIAALNSISEEQKSLTEQQYQLVDQLSVFDRLIIDGGAGTGKTFALLYGARMEAEVEVKTAILTRAPILLDSLKKQFENTSVDVLNPDQAGGIEAEYEVVFVDEGQDLCNEEDLSTIDRLLVGGIEQGRWRWFGDFENQNNPEKRINIEVFDLLKSFSTGSKGVISFTHNVRNTPAIVKWLEIFCHARLGKTIIRGNGPEVCIVEPEEMRGWTNSAVFSERFGSLVRDEVIILVPKEAMKTSTVLRKFAMAGFRIESIEDFKGMESRAIWVYGLTSELLTGELIDLLYKSVSRATGLVLVSADAELKARISDMAEYS